MEIKKITAAALALGALCTAAGCGGDKAANGEKASIKYWVRNYANAYVDSYSQIAAFQKLQEITGVDIEFIHPVVGQESEQFNVMIASGDYPDVVEFNWGAYQGGMIKAISDNVIITVDQYINDKTMPNFNALLNERDDYRKALKNSDGTISVFPHFSESIEINPYIGPTIRKDWLDKLGLSMPETIDDWYNVLKAFKERDPNGNGQQDEVPLTDDTNWAFKFLAAGFGVNFGLQLDNNGKVEFSGISDNYREYLQTMNKWYSEGLIDREYSAQTRKNVDYKMTSDISGAYVGFTGSQMGKYIAARAGDENYKLVAAPWPKRDKNSPRYCGYDNMIRLMTSGSGAAITSKNKYVEQTLKMFDYLYSKEGQALINYGIEGESYTVENGEYKYTDKIMHDPSGKDPVAAMAPYAIPIWGVLPSVMLNDAYDKISRSYEEQSDAAKTWIDADMSHLLPTLSFTAEESEIISTCLADVTTCCNEYSAKYIMGLESFDSWNTYVDKVKSMGVDKVVAAYQAAYDRYLSY